LAFAADQRRSIAAIMALTITAGAVNALDPLVLRYIVDGLVARDPVDRLTVGVVGLLVLYLLREGGNALSSWLTWRVRLRMQYGILDATVGRLHALSVSFHRAGSVGATITRLDRGIQGLVAAFSELAFNVLPAVVFLTLAVTMMARLEWRLLLIMLALVPLPALVGIWAAPEQTARDRTLLDRWGRIYARFNEVLGAFTTV
jgi:ATP-binding cassette subfamily B protein